MSLRTELMAWFFILGLFLMALGFDNSPGALLRDSEAGYDQAEYDSCRDSLEEVDCE